MATSKQLKYSGIVWTSSTSGNTGNKRGAQIYAHPTSATNTNLAFDTNNAVGTSSPTTKMTILGDGNVGIGITAPGYKTKIVSPSLTWGTSINDDTAALSVVKGYQDGANDSDVNVARFASVRASYGATADWAGHISLFTNSSVTDGSEGTERARITWDGNNRVYFGRSTDKVLTVQTAGGNYVGIGTDEPEHHLHVSGDAIISGVLYDSTNSSGVSGHVLTSEVGGPQWKMIEDVLSGVGGNGTAEYIPRWTDSDTIGDSVISQSGSNIGINMTAANPATELHIGSLAAPTQGENWASLSIGEDNYPERRTQINAYRSLRGADWDHMGISFQPHTSSSHLDGPTITGMVIDYDGHVGIGTTTPSARLMVSTAIPPGDNTAIGLSNTLKLAAFSSNAVGRRMEIGFDQFYGSTYSHSVIGQIVTDRTSFETGDLYFATKGGTTDAAPTERMRIQSDGNVGIGTTNPGGRLETYVTAGGQFGLRLNSNFGGGNAVDFKPYISSVSNAGFSIDLATSTKFVINSDGNVGVGTASPTTLTELYQGSTTNPTELQITNFSAGDAFINFIERDATGNTNGTKFGEANAWGFQVGYDGGDNKFFIKSGNQETVVNRLTIQRDDGKVGIGTTAPWTRFTVSGGTTAEADDFIPMSVSPSVAGGNSAGILFGVYPLVGYAKQGIFLGKICR